MPAPLLIPVIYFIAIKNSTAVLLPPVIMYAQRHPTQNGSSQRAQLPGDRPGGGIPAQARAASGHRRIRYDSVSLHQKDRGYTFAGATGSSYHMPNGHRLPHKKPCPGVWGRCVRTHTHSKKLWFQALFKQSVK